MMVAAGWWDSGFDGHAAHDTGEARRLVERREELVGRRDGHLDWFLVK